MLNVLYISDVAMFPACTAQGQHLSTITTLLRPEQDKFVAGIELHNGAEHSLDEASFH